MTTTRPATRCDYGVCHRRAVDLIETPAGERRAACRVHADRMTTEAQIEVRA